MKKHYMHNPGLLIGKKMKFLVTGSAGLIGRQVCKDLSEVSGEVYSGYHDSKPNYGVPIQMQLTNFEELKDAIVKVEPDVIIHLGAMTDVDLCEKEKRFSYENKCRIYRSFSKTSCKT